jgi:hypothetical protein
MSEEAVQEEAPAEAPAEMSSDDWRASLPDDLRDNPTLEKYSSVESLAKGYINASSMLGQDKLVMPKTDEDWGDFFNKIGRPEEPAGYEFEPVDLPEGTPFDEGMLDQFKEIAHNAGLTGKQANELQKWYMEQTGNQFEGMIRNAEDDMANAQTALRTEWGNAYDQKLNQAMRAIREFGGDRLAEELDATGLGNNVEIVKAFANAGEKIMGDTTIEGNPESGRTPMQLKAEIAKIQGDPAFYDAENLERPSMVRKMQSLMEELHGKDIIGEYTIGRM